ncbi:MAG: hypothetical protein DDG60_12670 [Anaerolineae bacterium]|nr:MAG: hypothetical protein DDG60_12670 [Anaerolineae bacterium]
MLKSLRYTLALAVLAVSLILLAWAFWPSERVIQRRYLYPTDMQLPTPGGSLSLPHQMAANIPCCVRVCRIYMAERFVLIL